jgi:hypothetical protein
MQICSSFGVSLAISKTGSLDPPYYYAVPIDGGTTQAIDPDSKIGSRSRLIVAGRANRRLAVQPLSQKYSGSLLTQITCTSLAIPARTEGRFAIVTDVGQGCDGRRRRIDERAYLADGKVVWS